MMIKILINIMHFLRLEAYQEAYLIEKAAKVAHYQRALAEQVCIVSATVHVHVCVLTASLCCILHVACIKDCHQERAWFAKEHTAH